jgi:peptide/nickel transport system permease protein
MIRRILRLPAGRFAIAFLLFIAFLAVLGPALAPYDPLLGSDDVLAHPSAEHWLGTDYLGRDVLSRILVGSTLSVLGAVQVALIALVVGAIPGILSVYLGRVFEWFTLRFVDTLIALPFLVFAVAMTALLGNGIPQAMLTVGILVSPLFYRVSRAATLSVARSQYVESALLAGASTGWIVRTHVWAKVLPPIAIALANTMGVGFVVVSSLTFLGIGVQPPTPTWGGVLASDLGYLVYRPYAPFFPTALIMLTVWAFNLLADVIRDVAGESGRVLLAGRDARGARRGSGGSHVTRTTDRNDDAKPTPALA